MKWLTQRVCLKRGCHCKLCIQQLESSCARCKDANQQSFNNSICPLYCLSRQLTQYSHLETNSCYTSSAIFPSFSCPKLHTILLYQEKMIALRAGSQTPIMGDLSLVRPCNHFCLKKVSAFLWHQLPFGISLLQKLYMKHCNQPKLSCQVPIYSKSTHMSSQTTNELIQIQNLEKFGHPTLFHSRCQEILWKRFSISFKRFTEQHES